MPEGGHRRWASVPGHSLFLLKPARTRKENDWLCCCMRDCHIFSRTDSEKRNSWGRQRSEFLPHPMRACNQPRHVCISLWAVKRKIMLTERFAGQWAGAQIHWLVWKVCMQKPLVCQGKQRLASVIMSPGWWGHMVPAANPRTHSGWNSNHPKRSSMEFHRARGRQINHRLREAVNHNHCHKEGQEKAATQRAAQKRRERGGGGGRGWLIAHRDLKITQVWALGCLAPSDRPGSLRDTLHFQRWQLL